MVVINTAKIQIRRQKKKLIFCMIFIRSLQNLRKALNKFAMT